MNIRISHSGSEAHTRTTVLKDPYVYVVCLGPKYRVREPSGLEMEGVRGSTCMPGRRLAEDVSGFSMLIRAK